MRENAPSTTFESLEARSSSVEQAGNKWEAAVLMLTKCGGHVRLRAYTLQLALYLPTHPIGRYGVLPSFILAKETHMIRKSVRNPLEGILYKRPG